MTFVNLLNTRDSVIARLAKGPLWIGDIKSPATTQILIALQRSGHVETLWKYHRGNRRFVYKFKKGVLVIR